eukprot:gene19668-19223_t
MPAWAAASPAPGISTEGSHNVGTEASLNKPIAASGGGSRVKRPSKCPSAAVGTSPTGRVTESLDKICAAVVAQQEHAARVEQWAKNVASRIEMRQEGTELKLEAMKKEMLDALYAASSERGSLNMEKDLGGHSRASHPRALLDNSGRRRVAASGSRAPAAAEYDELGLPVSPTHGPLVSPRSATLEPRLMGERSGSHLSGSQHATPRLDRVDPFAGIARLASFADK